jgi:dTDP-4-dehydrorhamnose reductase
MKVITLGNGFIADHLPYPKITNRILEYQDLYDAIGNDFTGRPGKPDVIINCIGKTGRPNVDWNETHQTETYQANVILPLMLAQWCEKHGVRLIHIGSGCIYYGHSPHRKLVQNPFHNFEWVEPGWKEVDPANPRSYYSKSKYSCDLAIGDLPNTTILRIRMPVSDRDTPRNLINKLKGYDQLIDVQNSMTFTSDFVRCVQWFVDNELPGIYHVANPGTLSAVEIMQEYQKYVPSHQFSVISEEQLDKLTTAKRSNCVLNTDKLQQTGFTMTPAKEALTLCMKNYFGSKHVQ